MVFAFISIVVTGASLLTKVCCD